MSVKVGPSFFARKCWTAIAKRRSMAIEGAGMVGDKKEHTALVRLLRLAREEHAALREDLADLKSARKAAELSLAQLDGKARTDAGDRHASRRLKLAAMLTTYEQAEEAVQKKLTAASDSARRLENLMVKTGVTTAPLFFRAAAKLRCSA